VRRWSLAALEDRRRLSWGPHILVRFCEFINSQITRLE
jgi:hypothetical protein